MPTLRRLLAALLVAAACVFVAPGATALAAAPCTCSKAASGTGATGATGATGTVQDHVKAASAVFTGTVEETAPGTGGGNSSRISTVRVDRVYKGEMITTDSVEVVTPRAFADCAGGELARGETYVFFVENDEGFTATGCGGTTTASTGLIAQVERLLGDGRDPVPPTPPTVALTPVNTDDPPSVSRAAAPGLALILIGLLGLAVVRRLARPR